MSCYRCGQPDHWRADCPEAQEPEPTATPGQRTPQATVECDSCGRDWVALLSPAETLTTLRCPWCRRFEIRDGQTYRLDVA